jgi:hypothetical protein
MEIAMKTLIAALAATSFLMTVAVAKTEQTRAIGAQSNGAVLQHSDWVACGHYAQTDPSASIRFEMLRDCGNGKGHWED